MSQLEGLFLKLLELLKYKFNEHEIFKERVKIFGDQVSYFSKKLKIILYLKIIFVYLLHYEV